MLKAVFQERDEQQRCDGGIRIGLIGIELHIEGERFLDGASAPVVWTSTDDGASWAQTTFTAATTLAYELVVTDDGSLVILGVVRTGAVETPTAWSATDGGVTWQHMAYFSFTTLTTLGYGDIHPVTSTAQAAAVAEAVFGVLTVALIIGRLVGATTRRGADRQ